jgi:general secretion pathway protein E
MSMPPSAIGDFYKFSQRRDPRDPVVVQEILIFLVSSGRLDRLAADRAQQAQKQTGERIDVAVIQLGLISEQALLGLLSDYFQMPLAQSQDYPTASILQDIWPLEFLRRRRIVPIAVSDKSITVAIADPFAMDSVAALSYALDLHVEVRLGLGRDVDAALDRLYGDNKAAVQTLQEAGDSSTVQDDDVQRLRDMASEAPVIRLVNRVIANAIEQGASDIHIEPMIDSLRVRYRVDGVMLEVERVPPELHASIASRVKILGNLNIAERRLPQDGRVKFVMGGREIDLRLSTVPQMHGESIVLRILDRESISLDFKALGFDAEPRRKLSSLLEAPNGILLVTGPTGSGKTTTLYAALDQLNSIERKVFTVEDPIEYQLTGVNQMQIKPAIGLDFVHCLRSILRQDPDVVMIGEMRDVETVRIGIQASLTGHLVLSTLHTNSAAASVTRLLDMGAEDYLLASTITGILAQRLVRRLCLQCAQSSAETLPPLTVLDADMDAFARGLPNPTPKNPVGCPHCRFTGFKGRTTICELLVVTDEVRRLIVRGTTDRQIDEVARRNGMETLMQDGLRKVMRGETTLGEVLRVARM